MKQKEGKYLIMKDPNKVRVLVNISSFSVQLLDVDMNVCLGNEFILEQCDYRILSDA